MHSSTPLLQNGHRSDQPVIVPLTQSRLPDFHALLMDQAQSHASGNHAQQTEYSREVFKAIVDEGRAEAFLVVCPKRDMTLAAVTYYDGLTQNGTSLYLEDIITAPAARRTGAGKLAMMGLAQIARQRQAEAVVWECAENNAPALNFYDKLGSVRDDDRHTWRLLGSVVSQPENRDIREQFVAEAKNISRPTGSNVIAENPNLMLVTAKQKDGLYAGAMRAYRSFSTFRVVNGIHIETVDVQAGASRSVASLMEHISITQQRNNWHGHTDITVRKSQEPLLGKILEQYKFAPLSYGAHRMATLSLSGTALENLADRPQANVIAGLTPVSSRPSTSAGRSGLAHCDQ